MKFVPPPTSNTFEEKKRFFFSEATKPGGGGIQKHEEKKLPGKISFSKKKIQIFILLFFMHTQPTTHLINFLLSSDAEIFVNNHRLGMQIGAECAKSCVQRVHVPTEVPFLHATVDGWVSFT